MKRRNVAVEIYRLTLMVGICCLHAISFGPNKCVFAENALLSCVVGFAFISGWHSVRFSAAKALKLLGTGLYCSTIVAIGLALLDGEAGNLPLRVLAALDDQWFLLAYLMVLCLAPLVNAAVRGEPDDAVRAGPLLLLVWGWGFAKTLPVIRDFAPWTNGLEAYSGLTLTAVYAAARYCRLHRLETRIGRRTLIAGVPICVFLTGIGLGDYNSPFAFALAALLFLGFSRAFAGVTESTAAGRAVLWVSPSVFSVYLIHSAALGQWWVPWLEGRLTGEMHLCGAAAVVLTGLATFVLALALDLPRRAAVSVIARRKR